MTKNTVAAVLVSLVPSMTAPLYSQEADKNLGQEIEALKSGQQEIRKELAEIKKLLQARPTAAPARAGANVKDVVFDLADNPVKGASTAKLTLVEFSDYQ